MAKRKKKPQCKFGRLAHPVKGRTCRKTKRPRKRKALASRLFKILGLT